MNYSKGTNIASSFMAFVVVVCALGATSALLTANGCAAVRKAISNSVCVCQAVWHDPTCQTSELNPTGVETNVFLVQCPEGLSPRKDAGLSLITKKDTDFDEMANATKNQIVAWTGMAVNKVTGTTHGLWRGDLDPVSGRSQFIDVLGCAVIELKKNETPQDVKGWWKFKPAKPVPGPDPEPSPGGGPGGAGPGEPAHPCDDLAIDEDTQTASISNGCGDAVLVTDPAQLAECTQPTCPVASGDSACVACAKESCCPNVSACRNDPACESVAVCVLTSGGLASCVSSGIDSTTYGLGSCLESACKACLEPTMMTACGQAGDPCGVGYPSCCANMGLSCFDNVGVLTCM